MEGIKELYDSLMQNCTSVLDLKELVSFRDALRSLDPFLIRHVMDVLVLDLVCLRKKYSPDNDDLQTYNNENTSNNNNNSVISHDSPDQKSNNKTSDATIHPDNTDNNFANENNTTNIKINTDTAGGNTSPLLFGLSRTTMKIREYSLQIVIYLMVAQLECSSDPLPTQCIDRVVFLLQDISFLMPPLPTGISSFMEKVVVPLFEKDIPQTLRTIYKRMEMPKPKSLKSLKHKKQPVDDLSDLPKIETDEVHPSNSAPGEPAPKKRKIDVSDNSTKESSEKAAGEKGAKGDSKLSELLSMKFSGTSVNHFTSGLTNVKALFGKQVACATVSVPKPKGRLHGNVKHKKQFKAV